MEQKNDFLGRDPIGRLLWRMSLPAIVAQLINLLYNLVDRVYIGHMPEDGALALTGVGVCLPIIMIVSAFAALVSNGGAPRASMAMGKGDYDEAEKILGNSVALQIVISAVLTVLLLLFYRPLLLTFGASENTKAKMLAPDEVEERIGHAIGGVCPFGIKEGVRVYLDETLKKYETVFPACGSSNSAIELTIPQLEQLAKPVCWVDVCKLPA